ESLRQVLRRTLESDGARTRDVGRRVDQRVEGPRDAEDADELRRQRRPTRREGARGRARLDDGAGDVERAEGPAAGRTVLPAMREGARGQAGAVGVRRAGYREARIGDVARGTRGAGSARAGGPRHGTPALAGEGVRPAVRAEAAEDVHL